jgi:hypothetical protein
MRAGNKGKREQGNEKAEKSRVEREELRLEASQAIVAA